MSIVPHRVGSVVDWKGRWKGRQLEGKVEGTPIQRVGRDVGSVVDWKGCRLEGLEGTPINVVLGYWTLFLDIGRCC